MWATDPGSGALCWRDQSGVHASLLSGGSFHSQASSLQPQPAICGSGAGPFHNLSLPTCLKVVSVHPWLKVSSSDSLQLVTIPFFSFIYSLLSGRSCKKDPPTPLPFCDTLLPFSFSKSVLSSLVSQNSHLDSARWGGSSWSIASMVLSIGTLKKMLHAFALTHILLVVDGYIKLHNHRFLFFPGLGFYGNTSLDKPCSTVFPFHF